MPVRAPILRVPFPQSDQQIASTSFTQAKAPKHGAMPLNRLRSGAKYF
jgi:hypothetical protein